MVQELEKLGIGRPSTYNTFGATLIKRKYVVFLDKQKKFVPLELGKKTNEWLQKYFAKIINQKYTAFLENELDKISQGENSYFDFIKDFWDNFSKQIEISEKS